MRKRLIAMLLILSMVLVLAACGGGGTQPSDPGNGEEPAKTYTLKLANNGVTDMSHPQNLACTKLKELIEAGSNGQIKVELHVAGSLGDARTLVEGVQLGTIEMADVENGPMSGFVPETCLWDMPYLFTSLEQAHNVLDGEIGQNFAKLYENIGIKHLAYNDGGFRYFTNSKHPIKSMADLKGLKIRVMESAVMIDSVNSWTASAVPMAFSEVYTALSQGTIDGQENPLDLIEAMHFYEVNKYLTLSEHFYYPRQYLINKALYDSMPEEFQTLISESAKEAAKYQREQLAIYTETLLDKLTNERGMEVSEFDKADAAKASQVVWVNYYEQVGSGDADAGKAIFDKVQSMAIK